MGNILLINADNVIYRMIELFCIQYAALSKTQFTIENVTQHNLYNLVEHPTIVDLILQNPNFYEALELKGNGIPKIIEELNRSYELYIISTLPLNGITGKIKTFIRDFPFLNVNQLNFISEKRLLRGDIIIDDNIYDIQEFKRANKQGRSFCVNMLYNKSTNDGIDYRIDTLEEIGMYLL